MLYSVFPLRNERTFLKRHALNMQLSEMLRSDWSWVLQLLLQLAQLQLTDVTRPFLQRAPPNNCERVKGSATPD